MRRHFTTRSHTRHNVLSGKDMFQQCFGCSFSTNHRNEGVDMIGDLYVVT